MKFFSKFSLPVLFVCAGLFPVSADVKMPAIFGDHMVLQQEAKIPVWGTATAGEKVTVKLGTQSASAMADTDGNWRVDLPAIPEQGDKAKPLVLTVTGTTTLTFQDVLIGDVWVASGQSNMEFGIGNIENPAEIITKADEPYIRLFSVPRSLSLTPQKDIAATPANAPLEGKWQICTPETLAKDGTWNGFTAVGYFFAREIQHAAGHPVGVIGTYWGGTPAQAWTSVSGLQKDPALAHYVDEQAKVAANFQQAQADLPKAKANYDAAKKQWDAEVGQAFSVQMAGWTNQVDAALSQGQAPPPKPMPSKPAPKQPPAPDGGSHNPANLYNAMISPIVPFSIKGVIWYQGESNAGSFASGQEYAILFPRMISDWREKWGQGDFPFLFVQLAGFGAPAKAPSEGNWPWLRESQTKTLALPNTGMAVAIDIGNPYDIHPKDKADVGHRLALAAKHVAYGEKLVYSGPTYDSIKVEGNKIRISFKNVGGGLKISAPPWVPKGFPIVKPTELTGFGIAGADKNWVWAKALIDGDTVVVSSDQVPAPVAVRYGWGNSPPVDLYNKEGLPAVPFRTDDWEEVAPPAPAPTPAPPPAK